MCGPNKLKRWCWWSVVVVGLGLSAHPIRAQQSDSLRAVHDALFASYFPVGQLRNDARDTALLDRASDAVWAALKAEPRMRAAEENFADLRRFHGVCGIGFAAEKHAVSFAELDSSQRRRLLDELADCEVDGPRALVATMRLFYVGHGYAAIQEPLSGEQLRVFAPDGYVKAHRPVLPPTRLVYDARRKELRERDGQAIDVLVIGSGPAGSVLAHELRRGGKRVVLLERGSFVEPGAMNGRIIEGLLDSRTSADGGIRIHNGMAVGGGTEVNVDLCFAPTSDAVRRRIEDWRKAGDIAPNEFTQPEIRRDYAWVKREIGTRTLRQSEMNANNRVLWDGATADGLHPKLYELNTYAPQRSPSPVTDKRSAEDSLLLQALEDKKNPLGMVPDADVRRVLFEQHDGEQTAVGVEVRARAPFAQEGVIVDPNGLHLVPGETYTVRAKTVILSAGALGSPTVLLRSGVANDQIGRGVVLHPSMPVMGRFDRTIDAMAGTQASVYVDDRLISQGYAFEAMAAPPVYAALMAPGAPMHAFEMVKNYRELAGFGVMLIDTPRPENRLSLDAQGEPVIEYTISDADKARFAEGVAEAVRIMFHAGASEVYLPTTEDVLASGNHRGAVLRSAAEADLVQRNVRFIPDRTVVTSAHMQATDKMGASPADSVVGQDFHVWGTRALYVVDGSIFPTSVGANPMQSIYTIAKAFADHWGGEKERKP